MKIVTLGRGSVGGGLAVLWRKAGHEATEPGRDGSDASEADVLVMIVPGPIISDALGDVTGPTDKIAIGATYAFPSRNRTFPSLAAEVNFAALYDQIAAWRVRPSSRYADDGAAEITERLITDAGYEPVRVGGLDKARALEDLSWLPVAAVKDGSPVFYRFAVPGEL